MVTDLNMKRKSSCCLQKWCCSILVATAVAARGLDIPNVSTLSTTIYLVISMTMFIELVVLVVPVTLVLPLLFNRNNKNVVKGLIELLSEANQEVPDFLTKIAREGAFGKMTRGGGRGGSSRGPSRDFRRSGNSGWGNSGNSGWGNSGNASSSGWGGNSSSSYSNTNSNYGGGYNNNQRSNFSSGGVTVIKLVPTPGGKPAVTLVTVPLPL